MEIGHVLQKEANTAGPPHRDAAQIQDEQIYLAQVFLFFIYLSLPDLLDAPAHLSPLQ